MTRYADFRLTRDDLTLVIYALRIEEVGCRGRAEAASTTGGTFIAAYESNVAARVACLVTRLEAAADAELAATRAA